MRYKLNDIQNNSKENRKITCDTLKYLLINEKMTLSQMFNSFKDNKIYLKDLLKLISFLEHLNCDVNNIDLECITKTFKEINELYSFEYEEVSSSVKDKSMDNRINVYRLNVSKEKQDNIIKSFL